ncbi:MAG: right-handed parallel beta-helix repeat-containing protein [Roseivivax sp.]|nr:right-handed parallel beta-helix repeat-containing protein [Roseivivax sp.]
MNRTDRTRRGLRALIAALLLAIALPAGVTRADEIAVADAGALASALRGAGPGDTLLLAPGAYGAVKLSGISGAAGQPVTLRSADPKAPATVAALTVNGSAYLTLDGLLFDYVYQPGDDPKLRPYSVSRSQHVSIVNSVFDGDRPDDRGPVDAPYGTAFALSVQGSSEIEIRGNEIRDFYRGMVLAQIDGLVVADNDVHTIRMDGLNFAEVTRVLVENNHLHDFNRSVDSKDHADMIQFWTNGTKTPTTDVVIRGNILNSGLGAYTQSIFMRNDLVDRGKAGREMFYRNMVIEENVIINAHLHGITVGETDGLTIANNTLIHNARSDGRKPSPGLWTPQIRVSPASGDVRIVRNVTPVLIGYKGQRDWVVEGNFQIQDQNPSRADYYDAVFNAAIAGDPRQLENFGYLRGGPLDGAGIGASRLAGMKKSDELRPMMRTLPDPVYRNRFTFDARPTLRTTSAAEHELGFAWMLQGGARHDGPELTVTFPEPGLHTVRLEVTGPEGGVQSAETSVAVPPVEVLEYDGDRGTFTTWANGMAETVPGAPQSAGTLPLGAGAAVVEIDRSAIAPFFGARDFDLALRLRARGGPAAGGELLRIHGSLMLTVSGRGLLQAELMTATADRLRVAARGPGLTDGEWHDVRLVYSAAAGTLRLFIDGADAGQGRTTGALKPLEHWGLAFGNPFGNRKSFDGELAYFSLKANVEAMAPL